MYGLLKGRETLKPRFAISTTVSVFLYVVCANLTFLGKNSTVTKRIVVFRALSALVSRQNCRIIVNFHSLDELSEAIEI